MRDAVADGGVTKADLKAAVASLMAEITASERRMMIAMAGIIVALVKLLP